MKHSAIRPTPQPRVINTDEAAIYKSAIPAMNAGADTGQWSNEAMPMGRMNSRAPTKIPRRLLHDLFSLVSRRPPQLHPFTQSVFHPLHLELIARISDGLGGRLRGMSAIT